MAAIKQRRVKGVFIVAAFNALVEILLQGL